MPDIISDYIKNLMVISCVGAICEFALKGASKGSKSLENGLKLIISLCLFISVFIPAAKYAVNSLETGVFLQEIPSAKAKRYEASAVLELTKKELEKSLSEKIYEKFGILPDSISIDSFTEKNSEGAITAFWSADITISKECSYAFDDIREYAVGLIGKNVKINGE